MRRPGQYTRHLEAGHLNELIDIEAETVTGDTIGGRARTWALWRQAWAQVTPMVGAEKDTAGTLRSTMLYRFTVRADREITAKHRIRWNGQVWNIQEPRQQAADAQFMDILAEAGASA